MRALLWGTLSILLLSLGASPDSSAQRWRRSPVSWLRWWERNRDEFLVLPAGVGLEPPTDKQVRGDIVPALRQAADNGELHSSISGAALVALARASAEKKDLDLALELAGSDDERLIVESAVVALTIRGAGDKRVRGVLMELSADPEEHIDIRGLAAVGLGLLGDKTPEVFQWLRARIASPISPPEVAVCALTGIGLIGNELRAPDLLGWLKKGRVENVRLEGLLLAHVVEALGRIEEPSAIEPVLATLRGKDEQARRSAVIALSRLVPREDGKAQLYFAKKMISYLRREKDLMAGNFGMIALGRIGARTESKEVWKACADFLGDAYLRGEKARERPFAALAIGLLCRGADGNGAGPIALRKKLAAMIRRELRRITGDQTVLAAQALSLGMIGDGQKETRDLLFSFLLNEKLESRLRGAAGTALGFMGDEAAADPILDMLWGRLDRNLRSDLAVTAARLAGVSAVATLVEMIEDPETSQWVLASAVRAVGRLKDRRAVAPLLAILEPGEAKGKHGDYTRAQAAVALGWLANPRPERVQTRVLAGVNYRASVNAIDELLTIR